MKNDKNFTYMSGFPVAMEAIIKDEEYDLIILRINTLKTATKSEVWT